MGGLARIKTAGGSVQDIGPSAKTLEMVPTGTDFDISTSAPGTSGSNAQRACRGVMVTDAGVGTKKLDIVNADGSQVAAAGMDCTNLVGVFIPGSYRTIKSTGTTTVTRVLIFY